MVDIFTDPTLEIEPSDTNSLDYGTYKYDIQFDSFDGIVDTVLQGTFKLAKEVTWYVDAGHERNDEHWFVA